MMIIRLEEQNDGIFCTIVIGLCKEVSIFQKIFVYVNKKLFLCTDLG